jgi:hypothetical protein
VINLLTSGQQAFAADTDPGEGYNMLRQSFGSQHTSPKRFGKVLHDTWWQTAAHQAAKQVDKAQRL